MSSFVMMRFPSRNSMSCPRKPALSNQGWAVFAIPGIAGGPAGAAATADRGMHRRAGKIL
jgi:hypothetical protein